MPTLANVSVLKSYRSTILKDKTSCPLSDYSCNYWTTSYQFTNQQIACYTPIISELDRPNFLAGLDYYVSLVFGENIKITCSDISKCKVRFGLWYTPTLNYYDSSNFYAGFPLLFRLRPNLNNVENLINYKVKKIFFLFFFKN